jgi:hypothetical protein
MASSMMTELFDLRSLERVIQESEPNESYLPRLISGRRFWHERENVIIPQRFA